ncbi:myosin heavy-chain kinase [Nitzschia inconspicua]|uniref:Myosin heavy-chain kinase n=1 Tax=Nitzschia inconspicua TaxID=303405 RepID=A0A9K3Q722_9STRA|nr:myosin heavy-chain kinase [Nitzschia inconspicua]
MDTSFSSVTSANSYSKRSKTNKTPVAHKRALQKKSSNRHLESFNMTRSVVDYEHLVNTSFTDSNKSVRSNVRPRWERKQQQQAAAGVGGGHRLPLSSASFNQSGGDRFIPIRAGMNMELSKHMLREDRDTSYCSSNGVDEQNGSTEGVLDNQKVVSDADKGEYASRLSAALLGVDDKANNRIMSFTEKAPAPKGDTVNNLNVLYSASASAKQKKVNVKLVTRQIPSIPTRVLDAPDLMDDYYLNLLSWSDTNILAVALANTVYLWNATSGDIQELCTYDEGGSVDAHISSVAWVQEGGAHLAVGTSGGMTQLWDVNAGKKLRSMDGHSDRVSSMAWNQHILSSGSRDTNIINHDVRVSRHNIATMSAHGQEVCGLAWSNDGEVLASGGNDNLLCLWDASWSSSRPEPRFQLTDHQAAVKALAWSPHERRLLATGGGTADRCIKFWNSQTGALLNSIDTGSQVCALQWNPFEKEILSSHGYARNQICLWKYPSMAKIKELEGHTSRVLHLATSPDGSTVVSAAGDETLRFWEVFCPPSKSDPGASFGSGKMPAKLSWTSQIR